jgi:hypothetical protein
MPAIYPNKELGEKAGSEELRDKAFAVCKAKYEEVYGVPLTYTTEEGGEQA